MQSPQDTDFGSSKRSIKHLSSVLGDVLAQEAEHHQRNREQLELEETLKTI